jgi:flagellar hook-associated protein 3 FlgL
MAQAITDLSMRETVYRAALATGARVIQPSLVDFLS